MEPELDRILDDDYLLDLPARPVAELRELRHECQAVETQLSYLRRLVQGRHDIVCGEIDRRQDGGEPGDVSGLVERLPEILADRIHAPGPGRMPVGMEPGELSGPLVERLDEVTAQVPIETTSSASGEQLAQAATELSDLEHDVSSMRRAVFDRIDAVQVEITRRYKDGEARVDDLLIGDES